ncbi:hypothetical protein DFH06DRAFT_1326110 [Mycena polygramma]|nr:hypothetical protein DFH06DRAFT_1331751 [Mycena polygramma]KAJ7660851.1 hypothetical protein DFH06DRAFT_1326110 [Mycena polygramma]
MSFAVRTDRARIAILMTRKPGTSKEEFGRYWTEVHGPQFIALDIVKAKLLKYEQGHVNTEMSDRLRTAGLPVPDYDGLAILEAKSHKDLMEVVGSEEFQTVVKGDAANFLDGEKIQVMPLDIITVIDEAGM